MTFFFQANTIRVINKHSYAAKVGSVDCNNQIEALKNPCMKKMHPSMKKVHPSIIKVLHMALGG